MLIGRHHDRESEATRRHCLVISTPKISPWTNVVGHGSPVAT